ncbi:MAG: hydrogenase maturation nickel metallochaperone HypA [Acidobacteria bacterium]|jgi:hydrogenase nickel incorporation protein HypA/HybF|nr:hydrogenase maturation nickel metallochaperone HypA [Acidobacteriota bacterium]
MHEFALANDIIETIEKQVTSEINKLSIINIEVGLFSGIVVDSLEFGLKTILADKKLPDVKINIKEVPTIARCQCGNEYSLTQIYEDCPLCHSLSRKIISGTDVVIESVELTEE